MSEESLMPERDAIWAKHDGLTPALAAEMLAFAGKMEMERNVWKHNAEVVAAELKSEHLKALDWFLAHGLLQHAVTKTLEENPHLADGDQCALKKLKASYLISPDRNEFRRTVEICRAILEADPEFHLPQFQRP